MRLSLHADLFYSFFNLTNFQLFNSLFTTQAANVLAAWRGGGFHCRSDEPHTCKVIQNFGRDKAAILPNCPLGAGDFTSLYVLLHTMDTL